MNTLPRKFSIPKGEDAVDAMEAEAVEVVETPEEVEARSSAMTAANLE